MTVKITEIENPDGTRMFKVEGKLTNGDAAMLETTIAQIEGGEKIAIDVSGVTFIDSDGASALSRFEGKGATLTGVDFFVEAIIAAHAERNN